MRGARKIFQDRSAGEREEKTAKKGLAFSWPLLGAMAIFLIGAVVWAFFMGFMVGQGHNPNSKIQEITGISLAGGEGEKEASPQAEAAPKPAPVISEPGGEEGPPPEQANKSEPAFRTPRGEELAAWGEAPPKPAASPLKKEKPPAARKEELFDFSFQIAAFKSMAEAENLQKKLAAISVKTKIQKSGKVQLLIADMRGPANTPEKLRQKLLPLKLGKPLQLSRKELSKGAKRIK